MIFDPAVHHRRSIRLKGYDYTREGGYFITACTHNHENLFGEIVNGEMRLNELGQIVQFTWEDLVNHVNGIELDEFVIMPNHIHGIIIIVGVVGAGLEPAPTEPAPTKPATTESAPTESAPTEPATTEPAPTEPATTEPAPTTIRAGLEPAPTESAPTKSAPTTPLSEIVRQLKTFSARRINVVRNTPGTPVWQRNYYEHIIRNDQSYMNIAEYIRDNPAQWEADKLNAKEIT